MEDKDIDKIAQALAAKLAQPAGKKLLGCGSASSSQLYRCTTSYKCSGYYECGGAEYFLCSGDFDCDDDFYCPGMFDCENMSRVHCNNKFSGYL